MLTGDKLETAENIGYSCKMFNDATKMKRIANIEATEVGDFLDKMATEMDRAPSVKATQATLNNGFIKSLMTEEELLHYRDTIDDICREKVHGLNYGLIVEGNIFYQIYQHEKLQDTFFKIAIQC